MLACKDEHVGNDWLPYTDKQKKRDQKWIELGHVERGAVPRVDISYRPEFCNHCEDPPCAANAPGCVIKRTDGIVLLDPRKAAGNEELVKACPFGAISWNDEIGAAQKCTFCAHLIDEGWKEPRCVQACALRALMAINMEDAEFEKLAAEKGLVSIVPEGVEPRVWYKNLHRFTKNMIAGEIAYSEDNDIETCAADMEVFLMKDGDTIAKTRTSTFGEFCFDAIEPMSGEYEVYSDLPGRGSVSVKISMEKDSIDTGLLRPGMDPAPSYDKWEQAKD